MKLQDLIILVVIFFLLMLMLAWFATTYNAETNSSKKCKKHHHEQYKQVPKSINKLKMNTVHKPVPEPYAKSVVKSSLKENYTYTPILSNMPKVCSTTGPKVGQCVQCNVDDNCTSNKPTCDEGICVRDSTADASVCLGYTAASTGLPVDRTILATTGPVAGACVECEDTNVSNCTTGAAGTTPSCVDNTCTYSPTTCDPANDQCPTGSYCEGTTCIPSNCGDGEGQTACSNYNWSDEAVVQTQ
jgi:hypothetical protein